MDVRYAELMAARRGTVLGIYERIDRPVPADLGDAVAHHLAERPKGAHGEHRYALADFGLDPVTERARFARYQSHYDVPDEV